MDVWQLRFHSKQEAQLHRRQHVNVAEKVTFNILTMWDNKPAKIWMTETYPMGNGRFIGMVFCGLAQEHIQFNEISLLTGDEDETVANQVFVDLLANFKGKYTSMAVAADYSRKLDISQAGTDYQYSFQTQAAKSYVF